MDAVQPLIAPNGEKLMYGSSSAAKQSGFLLLEVLVSILIFSLAILGILAIQAKAIQYSVNAEDRNSAALVANEIVSAMWENHSTSVDSAFIDTKLSKSGLRNATSSITTTAGVTTVSITWYPVNKTTASNYVTQVAIY